MSKTVDILITAIGWAMQGASFSDVSNKLKELDKVEVKVWREDDTVKLPTYAHDDDACMDVYVHKIEYKEDGRVIYHTGLHFNLPKDYEMEIRPRSSITKTLAIMQNTPGCLDEGYRGELLIVHRNLEMPDTSISIYGIGDRIAQIVIRRRERIIWNEVKTLEDLGETSRGNGGYGSTGK